MQLFIHSLRMSFVMGKHIYITNLNPLVTLQKTIRIITFSDYQVHTSPLFKMLNLLQLLDIVKLHTGIFMLCFCNGLLPVDFDHFFSENKCIHVHYTRLASKVITYALPLPHTNYGIFNIRFSGSKLWN